MDAVLRAAAMYFFLLVAVRLSGRRTLGELSTFDFVLLLVVGEATQQALLGDDFSFTNAALVILTLLLLDIFLSVVKTKSRKIETVLEGQPVLIVAQGRPIEEVLRKERVDEKDILHSARRSLGLERMDQILYAVLEQDGSISVIPTPDAWSRNRA